MATKTSLGKVLATGTPAPITANLALPPTRVNKILLQNLKSSATSAVVGGPSLSLATLGDSYEELQPGDDPFVLGDERDSNVHDPTQVFVGGEGGTATLVGFLYER